jgi:hypothetical protein
LDGESIEEMAEKLETLEPIVEENVESPTPSMIDGICINTDPRSTEMKDVIDLRRVGSYRRTFYLAKSISRTAG